MTDMDFMREALYLGQKAMTLGEIPVGAVIEKEGVIIGRGYNLTESTKDPTAHAELLAIREAAKTLGGWRLLGCTMYVTTEPCSMCAGAVVLSRLKRLCIGTRNPKAGACGSLYNIVADVRLNHCVETETGLLQEECEQMMKSFFKSLKAKKQSITEE